MRLEYRLGVERGIPEWVGEEYVGAALCLGASLPPVPPGKLGLSGLVPRDAVPFCAPDPFGAGHVELPHPLDYREGPGLRGGRLPRGVLALLDGCGHGLLEPLSARRLAFQPGSWTRQARW